MTIKTQHTVHSVGLRAGSWSIFFAIALPARQWTPLRRRGAAWRFYICGLGEDVKLTGEALCKCTGSEGLLKECRLDCTHRLVRLMDEAEHHRNDHGRLTDMQIHFALQSTVHEVD